MTAPYTQANRPFRLSTPLGPDVLLCTNWQASEKLSAFWELRVEAVSPRRDIKPRELLYQPVTLECAWDGQPVRWWRGIVRQVERMPAPLDVPLVSYVLTVVPPQWLMAQRTFHYGYCDMSIPDMIDDLLSKYEQPAAQWNEGREAFGPVQCRMLWNETAWAFINRTLEREGYWYTFLTEQAEGPTAMFIGNVASAAFARNGVTRLADTAPAGQAPLLRRLSLQQRPSVHSASVITVHHARPDQTVGAAHESGPVNGPDPLTLQSSQMPIRTRSIHLDWTLGRDYSDVAADNTDSSSRLGEMDDELAQEARFRTEIAIAESARVRGETVACGLQAGAWVPIATQSDPSLDGNYFVVAVHHAGGNGTYEGGADDTPAYENYFEAAPANNVYRPPRVTPAPRVPGVVLAKVVGPQGETVYTNKYGHVRVLFDWDNRANASPPHTGDCWVPVAQSWAGTGWGTFFLPRIGHQVVIAFLDGNPDGPVVVGSLHNAVNMPLQQLPAQNTESGVRTRSFPNGSAQTFNELRFDDKKGAEKVHFKAQSQFIGLVNNHVTFHIEDGNQTVTHKKGDRSLTHDEGNDTHVMTKGNREVTLTEGNDTLTLEKGNLMVRVIDGTCEIRADKDTTITSEKERLALAAKSDVRVLSQEGKLDVITNQGAIEIKADASTVTVEAANGIELKVGANTIAISSTGIELTVGANAVKLSATGVEVKGTMVKVEGTAMAELKASGPVMVKGMPTMVG
ncbi:MAG: type VI secretion system tip protein VgrG [Gemmatimonadaceae bacterium]|nr:type VI secretion system tip protein VgrG [Gemmatimonadaceae bacterium]